MIESNKCNGLVHGPSCTTWPPPWLAASTCAVAASSAPPCVFAKPELIGPDVSPWDFPPDVYATWEERVCIVHYDRGLPWREAEALALAEVVHEADQSVIQARTGSDVNGGPKRNYADAEEPVATIQRGLFAVERGPYG
jgi:hypothetical protein